MTKAERQTHVSRFDMRGLMRGDQAARSAYFSAMLSSGSMTIDEVRRAENLDPVPNGFGAQHLVQVNQLNLEQVPEYSKKIAGNEKFKRKRKKI